ncbi:DUF4351 domain-containing protein [Nostoc sp.]|uniref:DUF4351 domain-containing protein n=1 Tax=Nostoc sp. TaxID=1180 RepID=UPI003FA5EB30
MTVTLTEKEERELWAEANHNSPQQPEPEPFTILWKVPKQLAPLAATTQSQALLQQVVKRVNQIQPEQRAEISAYTQILAGLKYKKDLIRNLFWESMMRESVIYQQILAEGEQRGEQHGRQQGERSLILRLLTRRVGELSQEVQSRIVPLSIEQLENLGEALLDFQAFADLETWFSGLE